MYIYAIFAKFPPSYKGIIIWGKKIKYVYIGHN